MREGQARRLAAALGRFLVWAVVLLPPFLLFPTAKDGFRLPKLLASETLGLASLLFLSLRLWSVDRITWKDLWRLPALRAGLPLLLVVTLSGLVASPHPEHLQQALADLWIGIACLVGWSAALQPREQRRMLNGLLLPAVALSLLAILQFHDLYRPLRFVGEQELRRMGITSLAGSVGDLGAYLVLPALLAQAGLWSRLPWRGGGSLEGVGSKGKAKRRALWRWLPWPLALLACLYGLFVSQTLAALAALVLGSALLWWLLLEGKGRAVAALVGFVLLVSPILLLDASRNRVVTKAAQLRRGEVNQVLTGRLDGFRVGAWVFRHHPWVGSGHGTYRAEFAPAKLALLEQGVGFYRGHKQPVFANAHNEYVEAVAEWGLLGLLALGWALWVLAVETWRFSRRSGGRGDAALAWSGLAAVAILSLAFFPFRIALTAYPALLFLSWILNPVHQEEARR